MLRVRHPRCAAACIAWHNDVGARAGALVSGLPDHAAAAQPGVGDGPDSIATPGQWAFEASAGLARAPTTRAYEGSEGATQGEVPSQALAGASIAVRLTV